MLKKRKQHFVWEHYLTGWATQGQVWCQMDGRRFRVDTGNVAHERDFYRLQDLSDADLRFVEHFAIAPTVPQLRELAAEWVTLFREPFAIQRAHLATGRKDSEIEKHLDIAINNLEEDIYAKTEGKSVHLLADLKQANRRVIDNDDDFITLALFLAQQYMRTPGIMQRSIAAGKGTPFNVEAAWGLLRTIFATNISWAIFSKRHTMRTTFVDAAAGTEFVTGDQPLINTRAIGAAPGVIPAEIELWYPVSPRRGVLFTCDSPSPGVDQRVLTAGETATYNRMIITNCYRQSFAANEATLITAYSAEAPESNRQ